jgi:hypothetical protein
VRRVGIALALAVVMGAPAIAAASGCRECGTGLSGHRCVPNGGILVFNSVPPNVPVYWTLVAEADGLASLRRLDGTLEAWSDAIDPGIPGFPGTLAGEVYRGASAAFRGAVRSDRLYGLATYPDGRTCEFRVKLAFGLGRGRPNRFVCRSASGATLASGRIDLQGARLRGCLKSAAAARG